MLSMYENKVIQTPLKWTETRGGRYVREDIACNYAPHQAMCYTRSWDTLNEVISVPQLFMHYRNIDICLINLPISFNFT